ncbi:unnamed protein product [Linum trigynum]|uniref:J domain-containing protein n=1 Tax=Linum trigynum TaxID=586398 RepID=A0AAV2EGB5_9ROSI
MTSCGLTMPGTDAALFGASPSSTARLPDPVLRVRPSLGRPSMASFRTRATMNETASASSGRTCTAPAGAEMSFYDLLGIPESVSLRDIKLAYKQLARKYHPDVSPPDRVEEYTQRFIRVQEAYETLSDPRQRALYDRDMARGLHLAFSARRRSSYHDDEEIGERGDWRNQWQSQVSELKRRSESRSVGGSDNMSWAARMRRQKAEMATNGL